MTYSRRLGKRAPYFCRPLTRLACPYRYTKALDSIKALRKERVAELKTEKERLESLAREKGHADKLKARVSDMSASIARKEVEYQETKKMYEALARSNRKFEEGATKFREIYIRVENLEKEKLKYQEELAELRPNVQETNGTSSMVGDMLVDLISQTPTSNWRSVSRTSTLISPNSGMSDAARKPMNKIK